MFKIINSLSKSTKLRSFQYRLLMFKIFTNDVLYEWGLVPSENCSHCEIKLTIKHLLWECPESAKLWNMIERTLLVEQKLALNYAIIVSNQWPQQRKSAVGTIILVTKYYIFHKFCEGKYTHSRQLIENIKDAKRIELYNATNQKQKKMIARMWEQIPI